MPMPFLQCLVSPKLPTALASSASVDLPGYDLWLFVMEHVHILPTKLDIPTFEEALSRTLQLYPHAAGQLCCTGGRWSIELTNNAIPIDIEYRLDTTSDTLLNGDWVVQDDLSSLLNHQPISPLPFEGNTHLLQLKLTFFESETAIGVSWHHTLGDAILISRFMHTLSQIYQDLPLKFAPPIFKKYRFPTPSTSLSVEFLPRLPHLHISSALSEFIPQYGVFLANFQDVKWRIEDHDLAKLRSKLSTQQENSYLSKQDCLSAYVVAALSQSMEKPVQMVSNVSSFRHICAPFIAENTAGNMMQNVPATVPTDMAGIAYALRRALVQSRDPEYIYDVMSVASDTMLDIANAEKLLALIFRDDTAVTVNSNVVVDWHGVHFGCPDGSRFYTNGMGKHFLRCYRSNPTKGDDGTWRPRASIDISMGVKAELKPKLVDILARGVHALQDRHDL